MTSERVLVIDDDQRLTEVLCDALAGAGFEASGAMDGEQGMRAFLAEGHDVVVTDIIMPEREGLETLRAMKSHTPGVKIIAISGGGRVGADAFLQLADRMGADATLAKPFRPSDLIALIRDLSLRPISRV